MHLLLYQNITGSYLQGNQFYLVPLSWHISHCVPLKGCIVGGKHIGDFCMIFTEEGIGVKSTCPKTTFTCNLHHFTYDEYLTLYLNVFLYIIRKIYYLM